MKIYTEVIYHWDEGRGELVKESEKSFDYEGPLTLCELDDSFVPPDDPAAKPAFISKYPPTLGNNGDGEFQNWVLFESFDFKNQSQQNLDIAMYIPGDALTTSYKSEYESAQLGGLGAMGDRAISAMQNPVAGGIDALKRNIGATTSGMQSEVGTVSLLKGAEKIEGMKTLVERKQGVVLNPFTVAAFKGPTDMRTHSYTFKMFPQDEGESADCVGIVNAFKAAMLPSHQGGENQTAPSMLFGYPDIFTISFFIDGEELPKTALNPMFNVGRSVLTGCDLDFTTESVPLFFDGTQYPVSIEMKLSFMEIDVMYREKVKQGF